MNTAAMPADTQALEARLEPLSLARLDEVLAIEALAHPHPWSRRHFTDALASGYRIDILLGGDQVLGYFVAMRGVEEAHLLNLTVAPAFQRRVGGRSCWTHWPCGRVGRACNGCGWKCASATSGPVRCTSPTVFSRSACASATTRRPAMRAKTPL